MSGIDVDSTPPDRALVAFSIIKLLPGGGIEVDNHQLGRRT